MKGFATDIGIIHFIGIGGIGMSGIAEVMHNLGYKIQGSDAAESANVKRLRELGIKVAIGHSAENLSRIRRLALNLLRQDKSVKVGAKAKRLKACLEEGYLLRVLCRAF